jgi:hypothetical protein
MYAFMLSQSREMLIRIVLWSVCLALVVIIVMLANIENDDEAQHVVEREEVVTIREEPKPSKAAPTPPLEPETIKVGIDDLNKPLSSRRIHLFVLMWPDLDLSDDALRDSVRVTAIATEGRPMTVLQNADSGPVMPVAGQVFPYRAYWQVRDVNNQTVMQVDALLVKDRGGRRGGDKWSVTGVLLPRADWERTHLILMVGGNPHVTLDVAMRDICARDILWHEEHGATSRIFLNESSAQPD